MEQTEPPGYKYFREEIKREDEITHHRMTACLSFQAFLFAGVGFLVSGAWPDVVKDMKLTDLYVADRALVKEYIGSVEIFRLWVIGGLGVVGYVLSSVSFVGISATRISIRSIKVQFERAFGGTNGLELDEFYKNNRLPQIHGRGAAFFLGNLYTLLVPDLLYTLWIGYLMIFVSIVAPRFYGLALAVIVALSILPIGAVVSVYLFWKCREPRRLVKKAAMLLQWAHLEACRAISLPGSLSADLTGC